MPSDGKKLLDDGLMRCSRVRCAKLPRVRSSKPARAHYTEHLGIITFPKGALSPMALTAGVARNTGQGRIAGRTQTDFVPGSPANALQVRFGFAVIVSRLFFCLAKHRPVRTLTNHLLETVSITSRRLHDHGSVGPQKKPCYIVAG